MKRNEVVLTTLDDYQKLKGCPTEIKTGKDLDKVVETYAKFQKLDKTGNGIIMNSEEETYDLAKDLGLLDNE